MTTTATTMTTTITTTIQQQKQQQQKQQQQKQQQQKQQQQKQPKQKLSNVFLLFFFFFRENGHFFKPHFLQKNIARNAFCGFSKFAVSEQFFFIFKKQTPFKKTYFIAFFETHFFQVFIKNGLFEKRGFGKLEKEENQKKG